MELVLSPIAKPWVFTGYFETESYGLWPDVQEFATEADAKAYIIAQGDNAYKSTELRYIGNFLWVVRVENGKYLANNRCKVPYTSTLRNARRFESQQAAIAAWNKLED